MATASFSVSLPGNGPGQNAATPEGLNGVTWCGAPGTQFKFNPIANQPWKYCNHVFLVDGVQIGSVDANLRGEQCAITYNGTTYSFTVGSEYRKYLRGTPSFIASIVGKGLFTFVESNSSANVKWLGAVGTEFKYNPIPNDTAKYGRSFVYIGETLIGIIEGSLRGEECAIIHDGITYPFIFSGAYHMFLVL